MYSGNIFSKKLATVVAKNRGLPEDWCTRRFDIIPQSKFKGSKKAYDVFLQHLMSAENGLKQKIQIVVDSDLDGICSATILYKFLHECYPDIETVYSIHTGKQHGLSSDIKVNDDTTLVILPDSGR